MSNDGSRMYSRGRGGRRTGGAYGTSSGPGPSASPFEGKVDRQETSEIVHRFESKLGVSRVTIRRLLEVIDLTRLPAVEKKVTEAQMARMGSCGVSKTREYESKVRNSDVAGLEGYLLDTALSLRPVDTIEHLLESNRNHPNVREISEIMKNRDAEIRENSPVAELSAKLRRVVDQDVDLLVGKNANHRREQMNELRDLAKECFTEIRDLIRSPAAPPSPDAPGAESGPPRPKARTQTAGPVKLTKENIRKYYKR